MPQRICQITFYVFQDPQKAQDRLGFACRLIEKAYQKGHQLFVLIDDQQRAQEFDELLWTFSANSFVPHDLSPVTQTPSPITIGTQMSDSRHHDVLINLSNTLPEPFEKYQRLLEIIAGDPRQIASARERYKQYRNRAYTIETHKM